MGDFPSVLPVVLGAIVLGALVLGLPGNVAWVPAPVRSRWPRGRAA
jgi:hypothetical protein